MYGRMADFLDSIEGVHLERYRLGVSGQNDSYTLFQEFPLVVEQRKGGLFSGFQKKPVLTMKNIADMIADRFDLGEPDVTACYKTLHLGAKDVPVWVEELSYQPVFRQPFSVAGQGFGRLHEWTVIRTKESFPVVPVSCYRVYDVDLMPKSLQKLHERLNAGYHG